MSTVSRKGFQEYSGSYRRGAGDLDLMLIDQSGRYNVLVDKHADLVAKDQEAKGTKFGNQLVKITRQTE